MQTRISFRTTDIERHQTVSLTELAGIWESHRWRKHEKNIRTFPISHAKKSTKYDIIALG